MRQVNLLFATAALLALASSTQAATLVGADRIRITSANNTYIQIAEVIATQAGAGTDVALASNGATAFAPDSYQGNNALAASYAIDGVFPAAYPEIYHSAGSNSYLDVTFAAPANLSSLTIYGRSDYGQIRDVYDVSIFDASNTLLYSGTLNAYQNYLNSGGNPASDFATVSFAGGAVPEPASWALMLMGFGGLGAVLRRAKRNLSSVVTPA